MIVIIRLVTCLIIFFFKQSVRIFTGFLFALSVAKWFVTVSAETVHMAKSRPIENQSERSHSPHDYLARK